MALVPKDYDELDGMKAQEEANMLLEEGIYDFEVFAVEETSSKKGNPMVVVDLRVFRPDGSHRDVRDWLVDMPNFLCQHKIKTFCETCGIEQVDEWITGRCGKAKIVQDEYEKDGETKKTNKVDAYYTGPADEVPKPREPKPEPVQTKIANIPPGEIPF